MKALFEIVSYDVKDVVTTSTVECNPVQICEDEF